MKIGLQKIFYSLCQNNLKKLSWYIIYYGKKASKTGFVHVDQRKKITQRFRRMRLEALGILSYGP